MYPPSRLRQSYMFLPEDGYCDMYPPSRLRQSYMFLPEDGYCDMYPPSRPRQSYMFLPEDGYCDMYPARRPRQSYMFLPENRLVLHVAGQPAPPVKQVRLEGSASRRTCVARAAIVSEVRHVGQNSEPVANAGESGQPWSDLGPVLLMSTPSSTHKRTS